MQENPTFLDRGAPGDENHTTKHQNGQNFVQHIVLGLFLVADDNHNP
jgi:hypothetical protein